MKESRNEQGRKGGDKKKLKKRTSGKESFTLKKDEKEGQGSTGKDGKRKERKGNDRKWK